MYVSINMDQDDQNETILYPINEPIFHDDEPNILAESSEMTNSNNAYSKFENLMKALKASNSELNGDQIFEIGQP